ncbi:MAG: putative sulfoacetate transporter SauU [Alphaproteobacteria bacterium MarineAlpha11_Bin1]|nr:MAG: putative sulfoacetate transporter SauU [Alphaproteobacteria bacterium MarineAlpha11_Bin1]|tara:strand:- start:1957 stop:3207 length:1251 start_codon:yes stop_codon:yes gene_type:complete
MSLKHAPPSSFKVILRVFLPFGCGYYLSYLYRTINAVISENLTVELTLGPAGLGLLTSLYLIAFASSQIPLGVALDRYGPRKVNALLLMFAAAGAAVFSIAESFGLLMVGRALIGFGVSAALMSALKANALWFPSDRIPLMNNLIGAFGALGAVSATRPVEVMLHTTEWRDIFGGLAVVTVIVSLMVLILVPEKREMSQRSESFGMQLKGYGRVIRDIFFWRITLIFSFSYTAFVSYQTLWADPWLRDVAGLDQTERANYLLAIQLGFLVGLLLTGALADLLRRTRFQAVHVFGTCILIFVGTQVLLALGTTSGLAALWFLFGLLSSAIYLAYAVQTAHFPAEMTGRAITAMNFFMFVLAFFCQWSIGGIIESFTPDPDGGYSLEAHSTALGIIIVVQVLCYVNFILPGLRKKKNG